MLEASQIGAHEMPDELRDQICAYAMMDYEAGRMRADDITMALLSKPVAELYSTCNKVNLESTTLRADVVRHI